MNDREKAMQKLQQIKSQVDPAYDAQSRQNAACKVVLQVAAMAIENGFEVLFVPSEQREKCKIVVGGSDPYPPKILPRGGIHETPRSVHIKAEAGKVFVNRSGAEQWLPIAGLSFNLAASCYDNGLELAVDGICKLLS
jgi:hypothetical protein